MLCCLRHDHIMSSSSPRVSRLLSRQPNLILPHMHALSTNIQMSVSIRTAPPLPAMMDLKGQCLVPGCPREEPNMHQGYMLHCTSQRCLQCILDMHCGAVSDSAEYSAIPCAGDCPGEAGRVRTSYCRETFCLDTVMFDRSCFWRW